MKLTIRSVLSLWCILIGIDVHAHPIVRSIKNNTPFQFTIVQHNDISDCSPMRKGKVVTIEPHAMYNQQLLLGSDRPGLLLRPSGYYCKSEKKLYSFLNKEGIIDSKRLEVAFNAWKKHENRSYKKSVDVWFAQWLCGDISLIHNYAEIFGYVLNVSIARVDNKNRYHTCMVDYSEGLFSRQIIDIVIEQKKRKGLIPHVKSYVGQGGLCVDGTIVSM